MFHALHFGETETISFFHHPVCSFACLSIRLSISICISLVPLHLSAKKTNLFVESRRWDTHRARRQNVTTVVKNENIYRKQSKKKKRAREREESRDLKIAMLFEKHIYKRSWVSPFLLLFSTAILCDIQRLLVKPPVVFVSLKERLWFFCFLKRRKWDERERR